MCQQSDLTVFQVKTDIQSVTFSRWLVDIWKENWEKNVHDLANVHLCDGVDFVKWKFGCNGRFSVKSVYNALTMNDTGPYHIFFGKARFLLRLRYFCG